ncbi:ribonuclease Z [Desmospora sp. 8437]|nr:ribonuclease Z [Desmospora sp. 8437]
MFFGVGQEVEKQMELIFLGTGAGIPSKERNVSAIALRWPDSGGDTWLFDCGEGTQQRILSSTVKLTRVSRLFITHLHGDHIFGLPGLLGTRSFQEGERPLTIYGPQGLEAFLREALRVSGTHLRYPFTFQEVEDGAEFICDGVRVRAARLEHGIPCFGYRIEEPDRPGALRIDLLKRDGVPPGPHYRRLKEGKQVRLSDGRILDGKAYLSAPKRGRRVAILGDTRPTPAAVELARDVDLLVHEATYGREREDLAREHFHSTTIQAAETACAAGARRLILTHISPRYALAEGESLAGEARALFSETEVARDGKTVTVERED